MRPAGDTSAGLCYLDLDGFKAINDRYGHEAGDELLVTVARRIGETARGYGALAGRIGGDEFVVLAEVSPGIGGMIALATGILGEVSRPVPLRVGRVCRLGVRRHRRVRGGLARVRDPDRRRRRRPLPGKIPRAREVGGMRYRPRRRAAAGELTAMRPRRRGDRRGQTYQAPCRAGPQPAAYPWRDPAACRRAVRDAPAWPRCAALSQAPFPRPRYRRSPRRP